jgi:hypothetical protein
MRRVRHGTVELSRVPPPDGLVSVNEQPLIDIDGAQTLAEGIVDTIRDSLLVLEADIDLSKCHNGILTRLRLQCCSEARSAGTTSIG